MKEKVALAVLALATVVVLAPSAMATTITGQETIVGVDTYTATGINFINPGLVFTTTDGLSPMQGQSISLTSFTFGSPSVMLFDFSSGEFDFTVQSSLVNSFSTTFLNVTGTGLLTGTGFDPTAYLFTLTSNHIGSQTGYSITLAPTSAVPEPATLLLLGSGLLGLAWLLFRRAKKSNLTLPL